jgi:glycosyltransferase involved in cell wall biosynthesis
MPALTILPVGEILTDEADDSPTASCAMTTPSLITCIVPVYNGEKYLADALGSILHQTYRPIEIIVVDDGSTDGTAAIAKSFGAAVRYLNQSNAGPAAARNLGLDAAEGEFIAFLDADDLWHTEKLERQMARFRARPELDYCVTHAQNFWASELIEEQSRFRDHRIARPLPAYSTTTLLARRRLFDRVGQFDPALAHGDSTEWFLRANESGAVSELLPDVLLYRRLHKDNRTRHKASNSRELYLHIVKASLDRRRLLGAKTQK